MNLSAKDKTEIENLQKWSIKEMTKGIIDAILPYSIKKSINGDYRKLTKKQIKEYKISSYLEDLGFNQTKKGTANREII